LGAVRFWAGRPAGEVAMATINTNSHFALACDIGPPLFDCSETARTRDAGRLRPTRRQIIGSFRARTAQFWSKIDGEVTYIQIRLGDEPRDSLRPRAPSRRRPCDLLALCPTSDLHWRAVP